MTSNPLFAAYQVVYPAEVAEFNRENLDTVTAGYANQLIPLKEEWVAALEQEVNQKFTKFYGCCVQGRDAPCVSLHAIDSKPAADEHALYFLAAETAKNISEATG